MKRIAIYLFALVFAFSCKKTDEKVFPIEPHIEFQSLTFNNGAPLNQDTLILKFRFTDGDADLGLTDSSIEPYNYRNYYLNSTRTRFSSPEDYSSYGFQKILLSKLTELITYKDRKAIGLDTLPNFITPYNCSNWEVLSDLNGKVIDTIYYQANLNFFNIIVDYYIYNSGNWVRFDPTSYFVYPNCSPDGFNGKFPLLKNISISDANSSPFLINLISSKEGAMTYLMRSIGFVKIFTRKKIKLKVRIQDRALHKSNEIETSEIQF